MPTNRKFLSKEEVKEMSYHDLVNHLTDGLYDSHEDFMHYTSYLVEKTYGIVKTHPVYDVQPRQPLPAIPEGFVSLEKPKKQRKLLPPNEELYVDMGKKTKKLSKQSTKELEPVLESSMQNEVAGYYDTNYGVVKHSTDWFSMSKKYIASVLIVGFIGGAGISHFEGGPTNWDLNRHQGPIASRVSAVITNSNYNSLTTDIQGTTDTFDGTPTGRYSTFLTGQQKIVEVGDKVILNVNENGDILTFVDKTNGHRYCSHSSDCDY